MDKRKNTLSALKTCRFCLCKDETISSIYDRSRTPKNAVPLSLQILTCVSVEVFPSDRMPAQICNRCRFFMELFYNFKQVCRKSDESILHYIQNEEPLEPVFWPQKLTKVYRSANPTPRRGKGEPNAAPTGQHPTNQHQTNQHQINQHPTNQHQINQQQASQQQLQTSGSYDEEESEEDNGNVYNIKIGDGPDDESTCISVVKAGDKLTITKDDPKSKGVKAPAQPYIGSKQTSAERQHACKFCSLTFVRKTHVIRHMRNKHKLMALATTGTDLDQQHYSCEQCEESFATQDELMYHSAKHATENLTCPLCHEKFNHVEQVSNHIKTHADGAEFMCELCELVFTSKAKLDLHCDATHGDEISQGLDTGVDEESMDMDEEEDDDDDSNIHVKEEDDHMLVEIKKPNEFIKADIDDVSTRIKIENEYYEAQEEEFPTTYTELRTVDTLALSKEITKKQPREKISTLLNKVAAKTPEKPAEKKGDNQFTILRKAEEMKRKAAQKTIEIISSVTLNPEAKVLKTPRKAAATLTPLKPAIPAVKSESTTPKSVAKQPPVAKEPPIAKEPPVAKEPQISKAETTTSTGASDKSLRLLEKELQELKRTNNNSNNDSPKSTPKNVEVLRNRRPLLHSTPKTRQVNPPGTEIPLSTLVGLEIQKKVKKGTRPVEEKKPPAKTPPVEKKQPERRVITKENKEPKEKEATKTMNNNTNTGAKEENKEKEKESTKVVKNGKAERTSTEEVPRRSTRPCKIKDYAKMIRDNRGTSSDDSDDDDEEYKEEEEEDEDKPVEISKPRRGRVAKTPSKVAAPAPPAAAPVPAPADTPPSVARKRGRPRKDKPQEVPAKVMKITQEEEKNDEESTQKDDQEESPTSQQSNQPDKPEKDDTENKSLPEENNGSPTKTIANAEPANSLMVSPTGQTLKKVPINSLPPGVKPLPLPVSSRSVNTGDLCEMQIGKKTVKVHKIVMTKAEVEAMAKKGLLEMKDGTMVLKQGIKLPSNVKTTLVGDGELSRKKERAAPTRCSIGDD